MRLGHRGYSFLVGPFQITLGVLFFSEVFQPFLNFRFYYMVLGILFQPLLRTLSECLRCDPSQDPIPHLLSQVLIGVKQFP